MGGTCRLPLQFASDTQRSYGFPRAEPAATGGSRNRGTSVKGGIRAHTPNNGKPDRLLEILCSTLESSDKLYESVSG